MILIVQNSFFRLNKLELL